jgi:hypothetical protein
MANRRGGRLGGLLAALVVVVIALWLGYWYAAHAMAEKALARFENGRDGQQITCADPVISGFPLRVDLNCAHGGYNAHAGKISAALGGVRATAPLYVPGTVNADLDGPLEINDPARDVALTASWSAATATASAWISGLTGAGANFTNLKAENAGTASGLPVSAVSADTASAAIRPDGGGSYVLVGSARNMKLTRSAGGDLPAFDADARVTAVDVGAGLGTDPARALMTWLRAGASIKIDRLHLAANGAVVSADGTLAISKEGILSGALVLRYSNLEALVALAEEIDPRLRQKIPDAALQAINALSVPVQTEDGPQRQTTLSIINGMLSVGIIPVKVLPPVRL